MKRIYVDTDEAKEGNIRVEDKYYQVVESYKEAYAIISSQMIAKGSTDISCYEDLYLEQRLSEEYDKAEKQGNIGEFFEKAFENILNEEDYKELLKMLNCIPDEFDPEEELANRIADKKRKSDYYGDGLKLIAEYLESITHEEAIAVVTYYHFYHGLCYADQLISDIKDDQTENVSFERVGRAYTI